MSISVTSSIKRAKRAKLSNYGDLDVPIGYDLEVFNDVDPSNPSHCYGVHRLTGHIFPLAPIPGATLHMGSYFSTAEIARSVCIWCALFIC